MARGTDIAARFAAAASEAAAAARAARAEEERSKSRLRRLRREAESLAMEERSLGGPPAWASGRAAAAVWNAMAAPLARAAMSRKAADLKRRHAEALARAEREAALLERRRSGRRRLEAAARSAADSARKAEALGPLPPFLEERARAAALKACAGPRRGRDDGARLAAMREIEAIIGEWTEFRRSSVLRSSPSGGQAAVRAPDATVPERIYLPIPHALGGHARKAGAKYDRDAPAGSSGWYVPPGTPLGRFEQFLPLAFRERPPKLSFPPVRHGASSQNLWSVFDADSWDRIRHMNYARTGRRCVLCGKQSGALLRAIDPSAARREGSVECHEVWEWSVPDPDVSIGVQSLRGILTLCAECHMTHHDGWARSRARERGIEEEVRRFLMKRRAFLTRTHPVEVARQMRDEAARLRAHSGVALWIVDLSRLARQDYMAHVSPVLLEDNPAGVKPGQVAGISFVTDRGEAWPARSAREVYGSLADLYRLSMPVAGSALAR